MIGGYMSFSGHGGQANYRHSPLARVLPVEMLAGDDPIESPHGVVPAVRIPDHPVVVGVSPVWPYFLGYNKVILGNKGTLVLECQGDPFLADTAGRPRPHCSVHVRLFDALGEPGVRRLVGLRTLLDTVGRVGGRIDLVTE